MQRKASRSRAMYEALRSLVAIRRPVDGQTQAMDSKPAKDAGRAAAAEYGGDGKNMTNDDINRYIHTEIMDECWHNLVLGSDDVWRCNEIDCRIEVQNFGGIHDDPKSNPDYCSDDSPRSLLNAVVAKVTGYERGKLASWHLAKGLAFYKAMKNEIGFYASRDVVIMLANATAEQISRACVIAHQESVKGKRLI